MTRNCRDRTSEFFSIVQSLSSKSGAPDIGQTQPSFYAKEEFSEIPLLHSNGSHNRSSTALSAPVAQQSEFARWAGQIGRRLHDVARKLEELGKLARSKSLFNDPIQQIQEYTLVIKEDITSLNSDLEHLENFVKGRHAANSAQSETNSQNIVQSLKGQLAENTKAFAKILEERNKTLRDTSQRRSKYDSEAATVRKRPVTNFAVDLDTKPEASPSGPPLRASLQAQAQVQEEEDVYLRSRAEAVQNIEKTIVELGAIYQRLATLVASQHEIAVRIDANLEETLDNVNSAQDQLRKYFENISGNRGLILKIFAILIFFAIFFSVFVA